MPTISTSRRLWSAMMESRRMIRTVNAQGLMLSTPAQKITRGIVRVVNVPGQFLAAVIFTVPFASPAGRACSSIITCTS